MKQMQMYSDVLFSFSRSAWVVLNLLSAMALQPAAQGPGGALRGPAFA